MGFKAAVRTCISKWITFSGRAPRSEYWWFMLANILLYVLLMVLGGGLAFGLGSLGGGSAMGIITVIILAVPILFLFIASLSAMVRRLHDRNLSGWWYVGLIALSAAQGGVGAFDPGGIMSLVFTGLYVVGSIALLVVLCLKGTAGENRFGSDPLNQNAEDVFA